MYGLQTASTVAALPFTGTAGDWLRATLAFLPKLVGFLVVLVIGWIVARVLRTLVIKGLHRVHFDEVLQRGAREARQRGGDEAPQHGDQAREPGAEQAPARSRMGASRLTGQLVFYAIMLIALQIAFGLFGPNPVSALLNVIVAWLPRLAVAIIIVVVAALVARAVRDIVSSALGELSYGRLLANLAAIFIIALGVIAALNQIGVATTVTTPLLIAVLATIVGVIVVGVGGGMVKPMQPRWDRWLSRVEQEAPQAAAQAEAYRRGREDAIRTQRMTQPGATPGAPGEPPRSPAAEARPDTPSGQASGRSTGSTTPPPPGGMPPRGPRP